MEFDPLFMQLATAYFSLSHANECQTSFPGGHARGHVQVWGGGGVIPTGNANKVRCRLN